MKKIIIIFICIIGIFVIQCKKQTVEPKNISTQNIRVDSLYRYMSIYAECDSFSVSINGTLLWNMAKTTQAINRSYIFYQGDKIIVNAKGSVLMIYPGSSSLDYGIKVYEIYNQSYPLTNWNWATPGNYIVTSNYSYTFTVK